MRAPGSLVASPAGRTWQAQSGWVFGDDRAGARFHGTGGNRHRLLQGMVQPAPGEPRWTDRARGWNEPSLDPAGYPASRAAPTAPRAGMSRVLTQPATPRRGAGFAAVDRPCAGAALPGIRSQTSQGRAWAAISQKRSAESTQTTAPRGMRATATWRSIGQAPSPVETTKKTSGILVVLQAPRPKAAESRCGSRRRIAPLPVGP